MDKLISYALSEQTIPQRQIYLSHCAVQQNYNLFASKISYDEGCSPLDQSHQVIQIFNIMERGHYWPGA